MNKRVRQNGALLRFLMQNLHPRQLKAVLHTLSPDQVNAIGEVAVNVLYGTIPIREAYKRTLRSHSSKIEYIGDSANKLHRRKKAIIGNPKVVVLLLTACKPLLKGLLQ